MRKKKLNKKVTTFTKTPIEIIETKKKKGKEPSEEFPENKKRREMPPLFPPLDFETKYEINLNPFVWIEPKALEKMYHLTDLSNEEVSWIGHATQIKEFEFKIHDIFMGEQQNGAAHSDISPLGVATIMSELIADGRKEAASNLRFLGHSHVNMEVGASSIDQSTLEELSQTKVPWILRGICNKKGKLSLTLLIEEFSIKVTNVPWNICYQDTEKIRESMWKEIKKHVKEKTFFWKKEHGENSNIFSWNNWNEKKTEYKGFKEKNKFVNKQEEVKKTDYTKTHTNTSIFIEGVGIFEEGKTCSLFHHPSCKRIYIQNNQFRWVSRAEKTFEGLPPLMTENEIKCVILYLIQGKASLEMNFDIEQAKKRKGRDVSSNNFLSTEANEIIYDPFASQKITTVDEADQLLMQAITGGIETISEEDLASYKEFEGFSLQEACDEILTGGNGGTKGTKETKGTGGI